LDGSSIEIEVFTACVQYNTTCTTYWDHVIEHICKDQTVDINFMLPIF
jgi:hypothetical protein